MLLTAFIVLTAFGFGIWLVGHLLYQIERSGIFIAIAAIGAVLIMTVGGGVALTDIEQPVGQTVEKSYVQENFSYVYNDSTLNESELRNDSVLVNNRSVYQTEYERISVTDQFGAAFGQLGIGGLEMIVGALLLIRDLEEVSFG